MRLDDLGPRICIIGQSGSGKSTLAAAIGTSKGLTAVHLDQYRHQAGTQWQLRSDEEFAELHKMAIALDRWVLDGNYSKLLPSRLDRATGLILLDISIPRSLYEYGRRTMRRGPRIGGLEGTTDTLSWSMVSYQLQHGRANRRRRRELFDRIAMPKLVLKGRGALRRFYNDENLALLDGPV